MKSGRLSGGILILILATAVTACTPPNPGNTASERWANDTMQAAVPTGGGGVLTLTSDGTTAGVSAGLQLEIDRTHFTEFAAGCAEGGPVTLMSGGADADGLPTTTAGFDIDCDGTVHTYTLPAESGQNTTVAGFTATADEPVSIVVLLPEQ